MPPKDFDIRRTVLTNSSTFLLSTQIGSASTSPNSRNSAHFPSMTGMLASGPMSPRPSTAVPSVITATVFHRRVRSKLFAGSSWIARHGAATPGVYATLSASAESSGALVATSIFPFHS
jgi:hypothetical protein